MRNKLGPIFILLLLAAFPVTGTPAGKTVLGLYKSSEGQTAQENEIHYYLSIPLSSLGLKVRFWDIDSGIPDQRTLADCRGVVSWFRGPAMKKPGKYLDFLDSVVDSGRKLIILDNFGAYQDVDSGEYLNSHLLNMTLAKLGIIYMGDWTDNPELLRIAFKDSAMVEAGVNQDLRKSAFYYRYQQVDRFLRTYLSLQRTDKVTPPSPVVVTNGAGGFALSRYIYCLGSA